MLPKCLISIRAVLVRVTLIIIALALLPIGSVDARETAIRPSKSSGRPEPVEGRLKPDPTSAWSASSLGTIDANVFNLALGAANCAVHSGAVTSPSTLTVIDYSKLSTEKRLWVFDLRSHELIYQELVVHGQGSGGNMGGGLVFAYYPDQQWLNTSQYLGGCGAAAH